jgi:hypothetical protein
MIENSCGVSYGKPIGMMGVMTHSFVSAVAENPQQSYAQLLNSIRDRCMKGNPRHLQIPQLSCSHPLGKAT